MIRRYTYLRGQNTTITPQCGNVATYVRDICVLFVAIFFWPTKITCQQIQYLNPHSISAGFATGGTLFSAADTATYTDSMSSLLTIAHGYNIPTILSSGLWLGGIDPGGNGDFAASTVYRNTDWATGPCSDTYDATYDSLYNKVFKVTQADIAYHIAHYQDNGYQMPYSISAWPGNGRTVHHEQQTLAPYFDVNHNGIYDPQNGDYPNICGDEAIFFMLNDDRNPHSESEGAKFHVQVNILAFDVQNGIASSDTGAINNTVFMKLSLVNCSATNYTRVMLSLFNDYRIGCYENDRAGCDTVLNAFYGYNGGYPDSGCSNGNSYENKVAQGVVFLNQKLYTHAVFNAFADTFNPQRPVPPSDYLRNFQLGFWYDDISEPFTVGGDGFGGQIPTHYIYPGDPLNPSDWSDMTSGTLAGQRAGIGTVKLDSLLTGQTKNVDLAFVSSFVLSSDSTNEITTLKKNLISAQQFYTTLGQCGNEYTGVSSLTSDETTVNLYPNPTSGNLFLAYTISTPTMVEVQITDVSGTIVARESLGELGLGNHTHSLDISQLSQGIYICSVRIGNKFFEKKLVKMN